MKNLYVDLSDCFCASTSLVCEENWRPFSSLVYCNYYKVTNVYWHRVILYQFQLTDQNFKSQFRDQQNSTCRAAQPPIPGRQTSPWQADTHPPGRQTVPPPPHDGYCSGRYASYWNAFLLIKVIFMLLQNLWCQHWQYWQLCVNCEKLVYRHSTF